MRRIRGRRGSADQAAQFSQGVGARPRQARFNAHWIFRSSAIEENFVTRE